MNNMVRKWDEINGTEMEGSPASEAPEDNPMKNAEMQMEYDYDSIDGIINNGEKDKDSDDKKCRSSVVAEIRMHTKEIREHTSEDRQRSICTKERAL